MPERSQSRAQQLYPQVTTSDVRRLEAGEAVEVAGVHLTPSLARAMETPYDSVNGHWTKETVMAMAERLTAIVQRRRGRRGGESTWE